VMNHVWAPPGEDRIDSQKNLTRCRIVASNENLTVFIETDTSMKMVLAL